MSKDKPEVGDVWKNKRKESLLYVIEVDTNFITFLGCVEDVFAHKIYKRYYVNSFLYNDPRYIHFTENYEYKGKSKVKIEDLFNIENKQWSKK